MATNVDNRLVVLGIVLLAALLVLPTLAMGLFGTGHMGGGMWGGGMWGGGGGWGDGGFPTWVFLLAALSQLAFLGLLGLGAYLLYRAVTGRQDSTDAAMEELRLAYARDDLTDEEFENRRDALEEDSRDYQP